MTPCWQLPRTLPGSLYVLAAPCNTTSAPCNGCWGAPCTARGNYPGLGTPPVHFVSRFSIHNTQRESSRAVRLELDRVSGSRIEKHTNRLWQGGPESSKRAAPADVGVEGHGACAAAAGLAVKYTTRTARSEAPIVTSTACDVLAKRVARPVQMAWRWARRRGVEATPLTAPSLSPRSADQKLAGGQRIGHLLPAVVRAPRPGVAARNGRGAGREGLCARSDLPGPETAAKGG